MMVYDYDTLLRNHLQRSESSNSLILATFFHAMFLEIAKILKIVFISLESERKTTLFNTFTSIEVTVVVGPYVSSSSYMYICLISME